MGWIPDERCARTRFNLPTSPEQPLKCKTIGSGLLYCKRQLFGPGNVNLFIKMNLNDETISNNEQLLTELYYQLGSLFDQIKMINLFD